MSRGHGHVNRIADWAADALRRGTGRVEQLADRLDGGAIDSTATLVPMSEFTETVHNHLDSASRHDTTVTIVAVDIDQFDALNATHGAQVGIEVIEAAGGRLRDTVRPNDLVAQIRSDGFVVLWPPRSAAVDMHRVGSRIAGLFDVPIPTSAGEVRVTASIGSSSVRGNNAASIDAPTLIHQAATAVAAAKTGGRAQQIEFASHMHDEAALAYERERTLRSALRRNAVGVDFQPIVNLHSGSVVAVEALARCAEGSPDAMSPSEFIPIAEESGLITELGRQIFDESIARGAEWQVHTQQEPMVTVNVSNRQLLDPSLIPLLSAMLDLHSLEPRRLCLEITESVVMSNVAASMTILGHLKDLGLCLAIDDFGTGYSSLSYLRRLPVDILKIDRSFVHSVYNRDDRMIAKAIIDLAHTLGMTTVAEGVETPMQIEILHALNCDMAQGFLLHPPAPASRVDLSSIDFSKTAPTLGADAGLIPVAAL